MAAAQFSDGVGYDWVDGLKDYAARMVSDASWEARAQTFPEDTPRNREYYLLRSIFAEHFKHPSAWKTVPKVPQPYSMFQSNTRHHYWQNTSYL